MPRCLVSLMFVTKTQMSRSIVWVGVRLRALPEEGEDEFIPSSFYPPFSRCSFTFVGVRRALRLHLYIPVTPNDPLNSVPFVFRIRPF